MDIKTSDVQVYDTSLDLSEEPLLGVMVDEGLHDRRRDRGQTVADDVWLQAL